jgi:MGT family glycosyltransferase
MVNLSERASVQTGSTPQDRHPSIYILLRPEKSSFHASFCFTRGLQSRGYRIVYAGPPHYQDYIRSEGFDYKSFDVRPYEIPAASHSSLFAKVLRIRKIMKHCDNAIAALQAEAEALLRQEKPVLMITHPMILPESIPALRSGIPILTFRANLASAFNAAVPPVFSDIIGSDELNWRCYYRHSKQWTVILRRGWQWRFKEDKIARLMCGLWPRKSAGARARSLGFKVAWGEFGPCLLGPELVASPREFDFKHAIAAPHRIYIGSCVDVDRQELPFDWTGLDKDKPLLYCSLGTFAGGYRHASRLFMAVIEVLKLRDDLQGILHIGNLKLDEVHELPSHIRLLQDAPQLEILKHADIFITHGGFSSVREAIYFGVPMIAFPCNWDQPGNAARIVHHKLGLRGDIATVDCEKLSSLLTELEDTRSRSGMAAMQAVFREQQSCEAGIQYVERFLLGVSA